MSLAKFENPDSDWARSFRERFAKLGAASVPDLPDAVRQLDEATSGLVVRELLEYACKSQTHRALTVGSGLLLEIDRAWLARRIEREAEAAVDFLDDDYEFLRLAELYERIDAGLLARLVARGLASANADVREAALDASRWSLPRSTS